MCRPASADRLRQPGRRRHRRQGAQGASGQTRQEDRLARRQPGRAPADPACSTPSRRLHRRARRALAFDIVGFDPRGVGQSAPIDRLSDGALDDFLGTDPTPDDDAEEQDLLAAARALASGCEANNRELLAHVSTETRPRTWTAPALGDGQLNYLGKSYGTFLGATYADLFPERVGRFVLDGVVPPDLTSAQVAAGQAKGFELATSLRRGLRG